MTTLTKSYMDELRHGRLGEYITYHFLMDEIGDIDPSYPMLRYVCDRFELNMEQRYWLAFLFAATYCSPTVYYMYNEFPDFENVDVNRLQRWWDGNKNKCLFQSDRLWIRSRNQFVPMFESYKAHIQPTGKQEYAFMNLFSVDGDGATYDAAYKYFHTIKYFGRFSMFLYLEAVHVVTGFPMSPTNIDWKNAKSSRNGLCFAMGYDDLIRGHGYQDTPLDAKDYQDLSIDYTYLLELMQELSPTSRVDAWNVETSLCAYKKWRLGIEDPKRVSSPHHRYPGYYLDRQYDEIMKMQQNVVHGVDWNVLWQFRQETFNLVNLREHSNITNLTWSAVEIHKRLQLLNNSNYFQEAV